MTGPKDASYDISDSTDWLSTPLAALSAVDAGLRCQVCKEFYDTPMLTSCSHTFCSKCIRRCLSNEGKCPACRATSQESQLRSNWSMEELVGAFKNARHIALEFARQKTKSTAMKRKVDATEIYNHDIPAKRMTRASSRRATQASQESESVPVEDIIDLDYSPPGTTGLGEGYLQDDGLVACPMCSKRMKEEAVYSHIDHCTGEQTRSPTPAQINSLPGKQTSKPTNTLKPLATLSYGLLKDAALRKKLQELGISNSGTRVVLEQRHKEWVTLWNSNCDAARPKRKDELLRELNQWERTHGMRSSTGHTNQATDVRNKDFDREAYSTKQDISFKELIANARKNKARVDSPTVSGSSPAATPIPTPTIVGLEEPPSTVDNPHQSFAPPLDTYASNTNPPPSTHTYSHTPTKNPQGNMITSTTTINNITNTSTSTEKPPLEAQADTPRHYTTPPMKPTDHHTSSDIQHPASPINHY